MPLSMPLTLSAARLGACVAKQVGCSVNVTFASRKGFIFSVPSAEYEAAATESKKVFVQVRSASPCRLTVLYGVSLPALLSP